MMAPNVHPSWCGRSHVCNELTGEHRSHPISVDTDVGRIVATRIRTRNGRDRMELRIVVDLPRHPDLARLTARRVMVRVRDAVASEPATS